MITLHHLRIGRSIFTVWLLEEMGLDYALKVYQRHPETFRAPPELRQIHPLGKSPVIEDDGVLVAESAAIATYLLDQYGAGSSLRPDPSDKAASAEYLEWLHYPEGSAFLPLFLEMIMGRTGERPLGFDAFARGEVKLHLDHMAAKLGDKPFLLGDHLSVPDIAMTYIVSLAARVKQLDGYPTLSAYSERMMARPAFQRAIERAVE